MAPPKLAPIGLQVIDTGNEITRAFDEALAGVSGSHEEWLALVSLKGRDHGMHPVTDPGGIQDATRADQLSRMEVEGLVRRTRDPENGLAETFELTNDGEMAFHRYMKAVAAFDRRLRTGVTDEEAATFGSVLGRIRVNATRATAGEAEVR